MHKQEYIKILASYIGCKIQLAEHRFIEPVNDRVFTLNGVKENTFSVQELEKTEYTNDFYYDSKPHDLLVLRPLSDITKEEEEKWSQIQTPVGEMALESAMQIHWAKRINYYRSIGIDCDELIESGFAIDKKTLK